MSDRVGFEGSLVDGRLSMGRVVSQTFSVVGRNLAAVATIAFVVSVVVVVLTTTVTILLGQAIRNGSASPALAASAGFLILFIGIVVRSVATGGITHIAVSDLNGQRAGIGQALATGLRLALPLLGLSIVVGLGCGLVMTALTSGLAYALFAGTGTGGTVASGVLQVIGSTITTSISATGIATLYAELRRIKEGATPSQLAAVFA